MAKNKIGLGMILGTAAGVVAGLFLSDKPGKKLRTQAKSEYDKIRKQFEEKDPEKVLQDLFGEVSKDSKELLMSAKDELAKKVTELKKSAEKVDSKKYKDLAAEVTASVKKNHDIPTAQLKKLQTYLVKDVSKVVKDVKAPKKVVKKKA